MIVSLKDPALMPLTTANIVNAQRVRDVRTGARTVRVCTLGPVGAETGRRCAPPVRLKKWRSSPVKMEVLTCKNGGAHL